MRNIHIIIFTFILVLPTCKKSETIVQLQEDDGCIVEISVPVTSHGTLTDSIYNLIDALFVGNGINRQNLRYLRTYRDSTRTYNGVYDFRNVHVLQYFKGLPVFTASLNYSFKNGLFNSYAGYLTGGTNLNTTPTLTKGQLRKLFLEDIELFDYSGKKYKDSCFHAEFGYYNLNSGNGNTTENIVKAWHITPEYYPYPEAYYQDIQGKRIYYFNGIVYSH